LIEITEGIVMEVNVSHPLNANEPIDIRFEVKFTAFKLMQLLNE